LASVGLGGRTKKRYLRRIMLYHDAANRTISIELAGKHVVPTDIPLNIIPPADNKHAWRSVKGVDAPLPPVVRTAIANRPADKKK
jgi:hypothetical protein